MNDIDNRIVSMEFDNKKFEANIQTSIRSLKNLNESLLLKNASKGFSEVEKSASKVSLAPLSEAIDKINHRFSTLGIVGDQVIRNLVNSATRAGKEMVASFTIDPIKTGFREYETQIDSTQTILANTRKEGASLDQVNAALNELNRYADMTIYNFTEMTRNIGRFTAAGVGLDTSVSSIKGIANLAAISGSSAQQTSTAMYQLSQALASGTVKLMDWNSVVNANMGGQVFQDALMETARVHGVQIDKMIAKEGSFRETLKKGWLTTDILTETLEKFTATTEGLTEAEIDRARAMWEARGYSEDQIDAIFELGNTATDAATKVKTFTQLFDTLKEAVQSGWTQSWQYIVGDFEEAKEFLTSISDEFQSIITASSDARNSVLKFWHDNGGREKFIKSLQNIYSIIKGIGSIATSVFRTIFPPMTAERLLDITDKLHSFTEKIRNSLGFVNQFGDAVSDTAEKAAEVVDEAVGNIKESIDSGAEKNEERALELYDNMPQWMKRWVDRTGSADLKRISNWRKSNRDAWFDYWEAVTGQDMSAQRQAMDIYSEMPEWMKKWVDKSESRELDRIANWRPKNQSIWNSYWDAIEIGAKESKEAIEAVNENVEETSEVLEGSSTSIDENVKEFSFLEKMMMSAGVAAKILKDTIIAFGTGTIDIAISAFIPLVKVVSNAAESLFDWVIAFGETYDASELFRSSVNKIVTAVAPLGQLLANVTTKIFEFAKYLFFEGGLKNVPVTIFTYAISGIAMLINAIVSLATKISSYISSSEIIQNGIAEIKRVIGAIPSYASKAVKAISDFTSGVKEYVEESGVLTKWTEKIKTKFEGFLTKIGEFYNKVKTFFKESKGLETGSIKEFAKSFLTDLKPLEKINQFFTDFTTWLSKGAEGLKTKVDEVSGKIGDKIFAGLSWFGEQIKKVIESIAGVSVKDLFKTVQSIYLAFATMRLISGIGNTVKLFTRPFDDIGKAVGDLADTLKKKEAGLGTTVLKIAAGIAILVGALFVLSKMDRSSFENAMVALTGIAIGLSFFIVSMSKIAKDGKGIKSVGDGLIKISWSVILLIHSAKMLAKMEWDDIGKGFVGLFGLLSLLSSFMTKTKGSGLAGSIGAFIGMALAVNMLVGVVKKLGKMDALAVVAGIVSMKLLLDSLKSFVRSASGVRFRSMAGIIALAGGLRLMIHNMSAIADMNLGSIIKSISAIYVLVGSITKLKTTISGSARLGNTIIAIAGMASALYVFIKAMRSLEGISGSHLIAVSASFAGVFLSFGTAMKLLSFMGISGTLKSLGSIALLIAGLGTIGVVMGTFLDNEWVLEKMEKAKNFANSLGGMIGSFIKGLSDAKGTKDLGEGKTIAQKLSDFITELDPFLTKVKTIDDSVTQGIKNLSSGMISITGSGFIEGIASAVTNLLTGKTATENFTDSLSTLAVGAVRFQRKVGPIKPEIIQNGIDGLNKIVTFINSLPDYSFIDKITGLTDTSTFAADLAALAPSIFRYSITAKHLDSKAIEESSTAISALAIVAKSVPEVGLADKLIGLSDLKIFADDLPGLGSALKRYALSVRKLDSNAIINSSTAISGLVVIANKVPDVKFWDKVIGVSDLSTFAQDLAKLGPNLIKYVNSVGSFTDDQVSNVVRSASMIGAIVDVAAKIPKEGFFTKLFNVTDMASFASNLGTFGDSIGTYVKNVRGITEEDVISTENAGKVITAFINSTKGTEKHGGILQGFSEFFAGSDDVTSYSSKLVTFAEDMNKFAGYFGANAPNDISESVDSASTVIDKIKTMLSSPIDESGEKSTVDFSSFSYILDGMALTINNSLTSFFDSGVNVVTNFNNGVISVSNDVTGSIDKIMTSCIYATNRYSQFYNNGRFAMEGFANGIINNASLAINAANNVASKVLSAVNNRLGIRSPSVEFTRTGMYSVMGLVRGFEDNAGIAVDAGKSVGEKMLDAVRYSMSLISTILSSDMDIQPTIRPVIDTSGMTSGIGAINSYFAANRSISTANASLGSISANNARAIASQQNQNGNAMNSKEIVHAINNIEARIDALSSSMAQMKVVLDSGAMVGQMLPQIDYQLGRKAMHNERGI